MHQQIEPRRSGSYTANLLGNIRSHLAGLQGYDVMALELIQNADDAKAEAVEGARSVRVYPIPRRLSGQAAGLRLPSVRFTRPMLPPATALSGRVLPSGSESMPFDFPIRPSGPSDQQSQQWIDGLQHTP